jgi:hypothetical protein
MGRLYPVMDGYWLEVSKGHFTLRPLFEWTKDSSNLIGREQKFVRLAFTLKFICNIYGNPNSFPAHKLIFPNLDKLWNYVM